MKNSIVFLASLLAACGDGKPGDHPDAPMTPIDTPNGGEVIRLNDNITQDTTFEAKNVYVIPRLKQLFVEAPAVLTIEPGTVIQGEQGAVLVITRGAKIMAAGTKERPIVLTTAQAAGQKTAGWWGGLLVLGNAPINTNYPTSNEATFEAFTSAIAEGKFGGTDPNDNSGVIKYVRIEFAGFNFVADREFNNLTLCGVGAATTVDYVQVHGGSDDGVELFGGTVNVKHIVSSQNQDDGFDTDNGWSGKAQFIIVQNISHPPVLPEATNGYESDDHGTAYNNLPRTEPTVYNVTLIGDHSYTGVASYAAVFRRGTAGHYFNHIWYGFPRGPEFRDLETKAQLDAVPAKLEIQSSIFYGNDASASNMPVPQATNDIDETMYINAAHSDQVDVDPGFASAEVLSKPAPHFTLPASSTAMTGGATPPDDGFFDSSATFIGAMGTDDWTAGWTAYPQN